jgi:hypothetical protein
LPCSGQTTTGLELYTISAVTGGSRPSSPVSARPSRNWLTTRVPGVASSGWSRAGQFTGNAHSGSCSSPPPTWRHAPVSAGRQAIERTVCPPPACRSMATPIRIIDGWLVAYSRARDRMSSAGIPVCSDAHSEV